MYNRFAYIILVVAVTVAFVSTYLFDLDIAMPIALASIIISLVVILIGAYRYELGEKHYYMSKQYFPFFLFLHPKDPHEYAKDFKAYLIIALVLSTAFLIFILVFPLLRR